MRSRIMYIESKEGTLNGPARIGRVSFSKSGRTVYYAGKAFARTKGGYKYNHYEVGTGVEYWISGPRKDGQDRLYPSSHLSVDIDEDVREEYWTVIRAKRGNRNKRTA